MLGIDSGPKKRRPRTACDACRKRKVRCDSDTMPDSICTNCIASKNKCTNLLLDPRQKRRTDIRRYVEQLEQRVKKLESVLAACFPNDDLETIVNNAGAFTLSRDRLNRSLLLESDVLSSFTQSEASAEPLPAEDSQNLVNDSASLNHHRRGSDPKALDGAAVHEDHLSDMNNDFEQIQLSASAQGFFGPSSTYKYFRDAVSARQGFIRAKHPGMDSEPQNLKRAEFWKSPLVSYQKANSHTSKESFPAFDFPPQDLLNDLIDIHFRVTHCIMPVIYEPKFRKNVREGLHYRDQYFAGLVMMMCALSSRNSEDPRVFLPGQDVHSAGWKYFDQVQIMRDTTFDLPGLYELQMYCLAQHFVLVPHISWTIVTLGIRFCCETGVHRKRPPGYPITIEEEERKRVLWNLVSVDRFSSSLIGRPSGYRDEDFDADLPAECDDEHIIEIGDGSIVFAQPANKPSKMLFVSCMGRLQDILSVSLRALYSTTKSRVQMGLTGPRWEQDVVSELDSALNKWLDTVPEHLRWNAGQQDHSDSQTICRQLDTARADVLQHYLSKLCKASVIFKPRCSTTVYSDHPRSIVRMLSSQMDRQDVMPDSVNVTGCFMASVTLLLHIWKNKQHGNTSTLRRDAADVGKCKAYLRISEKRWFGAGRVLDLINELSSIKDVTVSPEAHSHIKTVEELTPPLASASGAPSTSINPSPHVWAENFIPQYGGRDDFPSIPMQIPVSPPLVDYGASASESNFGNDPMAMEGQLFSQMPSGFDIMEWDQYIAKMTEELDQQSNSNMGTL